MLSLVERETRSPVVEEWTPKLGMASMAVEERKFVQVQSGSKAQVCSLE